MALTKVNITWGREKFKDVALDKTASPGKFMATVYNLTGLLFVVVAMSILTLRIDK